ncbi:unnamed protein product, partial [Musa acuminata subsp. burmannicoides]
MEILTCRNSEMCKALNCSLLLFKFVQLLLLALSRKQSEGCTKEGKKVKKNCCRRNGKHLETINKADKVKQLLLKEVLDTHKAVVSGKMSRFSDKMHGTRKRKFTREV